MATEQKKTVNGEEAAAYGGYTTRHQYEKAREKKISLQNVIFLAVAIVLFIPAVLGIISLVRGDFFPENSPEGEGGDTVRVPTGTQLNENAKDPEKMIRELEVSLATVTVEKEDGTISYGSGFVISEDGYILASDSILKSGGKSALRVYIDGISYTATLVETRSDLGFALLRVDSMYGLIPVTIGNFSFVERGETLFAVGASYGSDFCGTALSGMVASVGSSIRVKAGEDSILVPLAYLDMVPNSSVYGAPVVDAAGNAVGFCTDAIASPYGELATVVPIHTVYTLVNQMLGN